MSWKTFLLIVLPLTSLEDIGLGFLLVWICEFWGHNTSYTHFMPAETLAYIYDAAFPFAQCLFPLWNFLKHRLKCELYITPLLLRSSEAFRHKNLKIKDLFFPLLILTPTVNGIFAWLRISGCIRIQRETTVKNNSHQCFLTDHERHITESINK